MDATLINECRETYKGEILMEVERAIRAAMRQDRTILMALLPELADFELPERRNPRHLWEGDGELLTKVLVDEVPNTFVDVMEGGIGEPEIVGFVFDSPT